MAPMEKEDKERSCGVLMHVTSLPGPFGIGSLGKHARFFVDTLREMDVSLWQILPLGPTGYGDSPYAALSAFAGNELMIDIESLVYDGLIDMDTFCRESATEQFSSDRVDFEHVKPRKMKILRDAAGVFLSNPDKEYLKFKKKNSWWLDDYALSRSLGEYYNDTRWFCAWDKEIALRKPEAIKAWSEKLASETEIWKVLQYFFFSQWDELHKYAASRGIRIIGDIPIFVAADSSDVWASPELFKIDAQGKMQASSGVPPDAFSATGQLWGNPVYNWKEHEKDNYAWWNRRYDHTLSLVDMVRIDHFRGIAAAWEVPAGSETAINGKWVKGPGKKLIDSFKKPLHIIAEDLGVITDDVNELRLYAGVPGTKVFHFAWDLDENGELKSDNFYLPHTYDKLAACYTGTHDNNTTRGWFESLSEEMKDKVRRYLESDNNDIVWQTMRSLLMSSAMYAIFPVQDILGLDGSARMNLPATVGTSNWSWRLNPDNFQPWMKDRMRSMIRLYGRAPRR